MNILKGIICRANLSMFMLSTKPPKDHDWSSFHVEFKFKSNIEDMTFSLKGFNKCCKP